MSDEALFLYGWFSVRLEEGGNYAEGQVLVVAPTIEEARRYAVDAGYPTEQLAGDPVIFGKGTVQFVVMKSNRTISMRSETRVL